MRIITHMHARTLVNTRRRLGLTQQAAARAAGVSLRAVQKWEAGHRSSSIARARYEAMLRKPETAHKINGEV